MTKESFSIACIYAFLFLIYFFASFIAADKKARTIKPTKNPQVNRSVLGINLRIISQAKPNKLTHEAKRTNKLADMLFSFQEYITCGRFFTDTVLLSLSLWLAYRRERNKRTDSARDKKEINHPKGRGESQTCSQRIPVRSLSLGQAGSLYPVEPRKFYRNQRTGGLGDGFGFELPLLPPFGPPPGRGLEPIVYSPFIEYRSYPRLPCVVRPGPRRGYSPLCTRHRRPSKRHFFVFIISPFKRLLS